MSNKLKTLSESQLEHLISEKISDYIEEDCNCKVLNVDTPNIDSEADAGITNKREMSFEVHLSYEEE